jgi:hypothetical protein
MNGMKRVQILQEQSVLLRKMAESFDDPTMKSDLLNLAEQCDRLAAAAARKISDRLQQPINEKTPSPVDDA